VVDLLWGAVQFVGLNSGHRQQLLKIQNLFSVRGLVKNKRISGFAYEPSWLAGQIAALYLPWLLAAVLMRYRALRSEITRHSSLVHWIEPILLIGAIVGVLMTYSRSGLFVVGLAGVVTFALAGGETVSAFRRWFLAGFRLEGVKRRWSVAGIRVVLVVLVVALLVGVSAFLADKGYIATFFKSEKTDLFSYAVDVYLGPRLAYTTAALSAFQHYPLTGVGLGASGFWIYQNMPDWVLSGVPEIAQQMSPQSSLYPNPKNIYVRLLAETGLLGLVLFLAFYLTLFAEALSLLRGSTAARWLAAAGIFALTAVMLQGISQDSFAMPEMWVNLGMLAGSAGYFINSDPKGFKNL
jgi:O-antigen ligase